MLIELRNYKHGTTVRFQLKHKSEIIPARRVRRMNHVLCPDGCCKGFLCESPEKDDRGRKLPQHKSRRAVIIVSEWGGEGIEVYKKQSTNLLTEVTV